MGEHLSKEHSLPERLYELMRQETDTGNIAGMSLLLRRDGHDVCFLKAGFADLENQVPIERGTIYRLYSLTKPVTGAAIMYLLENGMLNLYDPVSRYLPAFGQQTVITDNGPAQGQKPNGLLAPCSGTSRSGLAQRTSFPQETWPTPSPGVLLHFIRGKFSDTAPAPIFSAL